MLTAQNLHKTYRKGKVVTPVLHGVDLEIEPGEFLSIVGYSGSGKSTLIHLLGTLDRPDQGRIYFQGERIDNLSSRQRDYVRNHVFGYVFQFYHLLPELTAVQNVMMPQMIRHSVWGWWRNRSKARQEAEALLERVDLTGRAHHRPSQMSGGEIQRVAIARALINRPKILFADEPTGNLDEENGRAIMDLLHRLNREDGTTIIMVTHNPDLAAETDRTVRLTQGRVEQVPMSLPAAI